MVEKEEKEVSSVSDIKELKLQGQFISKYNTIQWRFVEVLSAFSQY